MPRKRDYAKEWQAEKARIADKEARVVVKLPVQVAEDFAARCELNETSRSAVLKSYIERYTYQDFDQEIN